MDSLEIILERADRQYTDAEKEAMAAEKNATYVELLKEMSPADCQVVEDAKAGIQAAYDGGFKSAGLGEATEHPNVTYKMSSFKDLLNICQ